MLVVIEGPDNSGKTTLGNWLSKRLNLELHHSGGPPKSPEEMAGRVNDLLILPRPVIFDRFPCISDPIYAKILGRETPITRLMIDHFLSEDPLIIYCRAPLKIMLEDDRGVGIHNTAEHHAAVQANALKLIHEYDRTMIEFPHLSYDFTAGGEQWRELLVKHIGGK